MKSLPFLLAAVLAAAVAHAQPDPQPAGAATLSDSFFEQRVIEALAADGIVLSRLGVTLEIEQIGDKVLVSLVEHSRRVAASTRVDALPADRDLAIATLTRAAAELTRQLAGRSAPVAPPEPATVERVELPPRDEAAEREVAELRYRRKAIRFGADLVIQGNQYGVSATRRWVAYRGESHQRLDPRQFYELLGRSDLADGYRSRRNTGMGLMIGGYAAMAGGLIYMLASLDFEGCSFNDPDYRACSDAQDRQNDRALTVGITAGVAGGLVALLGHYYWNRPHPISENEAKGLADRYNDDLRRQLGLPVAGTPPRRRIRDVRWAPVLTANGASLAVGGRF
jgi:hypothetical protein